ncbi:MAG: carbamoyltransferase N-terminal domain-containing protein [Pseudomonadota bacterium]
MRILGISAWYHDAAAALVVDGDIVGAAHEERFSRKKQDPSFPSNAARWCLDHAGVGLEDLDAVVFYDKPLLTFDRLLETWHTTAPTGLVQFLRSVPVWLKEKLSFRKQLRDGLLAVDRGVLGADRIRFAEHHLSHAASAFYPSPFDEAAILTLDGVGEWATASIGHGRGREIRFLRELRFPHSLGLLYSAFTQFLGFRVNSGEYKLMGLAPYGDSGGERTARFEALIREQMTTLGPDGAIYLHPQWFRYMTALEMIHRERWTALFGFPPRGPDDEIEPHHADLALAIQRVTEDAVLRLARTAQELTGARSLCMAGGVALNCVANGKLLRSGLFDEIWIQPAAGDAGGALGAALALHHMGFQQERAPAGPGDRMRHSLLGPSYTDEEIARVAGELGGVGRRLGSLDAAAREAARRVAAGEIGGWFQGALEWGPRALGSRSIVADPRDPAMQRRLNLKIKFREGFRPFAPVVLEEEAPAWFDIDVPSPYMLFTADVRDAHRTSGTAPRDAGWREQLSVPRSSIPAVTHVDDSARLQTVAADHPTFRRLLEAFRDETGCPVMINTSFNVRGEPIVCSPADAYRCFMRTDMDFLVMGEHLFEKAAQPAPDADAPVGPEALD